MPKNRRHHRSLSTHLPAADPFEALFADGKRRKMLFLSLGYYPVCVSAESKSETIQREQRFESECHKAPIGRRES